MPDFFCFWWQCTKSAASGTVPLARSWWWLLAIPAIAILRYLGAGRGTEMILPNHPVLDPILDGMLSAIAGFVIICGGAFLVRLTSAPATLFSQERTRAEASQTEVADLRAKMTNPVPDITIDTRKTPEILTHPNDNDRNVHIIIRDFHLTNRSNFGVSIEVRLKFNIGGMAVIPNQDDMPLDFVETIKEHDPSIGKHLGRRIPLSAHEGVTGYLSYRISDPLTRAIATAHSMDTPDFLNTLEKMLEIWDYVSGVTKFLSFNTFGPYSFRELEPHSE